MAFAEVTAGADVGDRRIAAMAEADPVVQPPGGVGTPDGFRRLWTPHRMSYIKGESSEDTSGCPFCRIPTRPDEDGLVVARGRTVYAVLNLHPYNPGHLMVLPYRHVAELENLAPEESAELMAFTRQAIRVLKAQADPPAFNVGMNLGHVAGGSLADHLHQHVVPRWGGDANFMAVIGQTKVIPQLLSETRKLLAETWERLTATAGGASPSGQGEPAG